ncbi:MAG: FHA domain-containing protein [Anaerolineaceae bacterium]
MENEFPVLIAQNGDLNGQRWLIKSELLIGRDPDCQIVIADRQVSRHHARLIFGRKGVQIEDLGSKNGTFCNGKQVIDLQTLQDGDSIQVAIVHNFTFLSSDATMPMDADHIGKILEKGNLELDVRSRRVWVKNEEVIPALSAPQFRLLQALYDRPGQVVSRNELIDITWGEDEAAGVSEQAFDALVRRLRERLAKIDPDHEYIVTIRGHGMRLDNPH